MLARLLARLAAVQRATTAHERDAIYRFRYDVYVRELAREIGGVDHERRIVKDDEDEAEEALHLYVGRPGHVLGAARLRSWTPSRAPEAIAALFSFDEFPSIGKFHVAEIGRFMIRPSARGKLMLPGLASAAFDYLAGERRVDLVFCYCRPGLVDYYRRLGARPYGGRLIDAPEGVEIPLVAVISDLEHYRRVGAPQADMVGKHFGPGRRSPVDATPFEHRFVEHQHSVLTEPAAVLRELETVLLRGQRPVPPLFQSLDARALRVLAASGFILTVPAGSIVTREGHREKELFLVVDGELEVVAGGRRLSQMTRGDVFGEIAFFTKRGERSATVRSVTTTRIFGLKRTFLESLKKRDPNSAILVLQNLGEILAERLARTSKANSAQVD